MKWGKSGQNNRTWHAWFAWFPVPTRDGFWVWLEPVLRRDGCSEAASGHVGPIWEYTITASPPHD